MNLQEEFIKEYRDGSWLKKAFLVLIGVVFGIVCLFLILCARLFHVTYNTVNVMAYYFLMPLSWAFMLDWILGLPYILTVAYTVAWLAVFIVKFGKFQAWCDMVFDRSVDFLLWFKRVGWNYHVASVIICVVVPVLVYAALFYLM